MSLCICVFLIVFCLFICVRMCVRVCMCVCMCIFVYAYVCVIKDTKTLARVNLLKTHYIFSLCVFKDFYFVCRTPLPLKRRLNKHSFYDIIIFDSENSV